MAGGRRTTPETIVPINYPDLRLAVPPAGGAAEPQAGDCGWKLGDQGRTDRVRGQAGGCG